MERILIVLAWGVLVAWAVRPVPGRGIPVGRGWAHAYLSNRQAATLGVVLLAVAVIIRGLALGRRDTDLALVGLCLGWLGALLAFHGRKAA